MRAAPMATNRARCLISASSISSSFSRMIPSMLFLTASKSDASRLASPSACCRATDQLQARNLSTLACVWPRHCRHQIAQGHHRGALLRLVADALPSTALSVDGGVHLLLHVLQRPLRLQARVGHHFGGSSQPSLPLSKESVLSNRQPQEA